MEQTSPAAKTSGEHVIDGDASVRVEADARSIAALRARNPLAVR
eukprot:CAMPEP_0177702174 /NCGR_PEP_ID=MMETSP0484_2-20121128/6999_1 /TAXON_ID=354590 /ORGANISM="Rhodomonas lens, Strain RHODO" /LENGTH=43 /DNA_ID= /DNA_START= /DNA_END= /DNA_ORIENTATION=